MKGAEMNGYGYIIGPHAYGSIIDQRVRYAAVLDNGLQLAAYDGSAEGLESHGTVFDLQPTPEYPDTWPDWAKKAAPKRGIANGLEHFALVSEEHLLHNLEGMEFSGVALVAPDLVLVETQGLHVPLAIWHGAATRYFDIREVRASFARGLVKFASA